MPKERPLVGCRVVEEVVFSALDVAHAIPKDVPGDEANLWNQSVCGVAQEMFAIDHDIVEHVTDTWLFRIYVRKSDGSEARGFRGMLTESGRWELWNLHA